MKKVETRLQERDAAWILARCKGTGTYTVVLTPPSPANPNSASLIQASEFGGLRFKQFSALGVEIDLTDPPDNWKLKMTGPNGLLQADEIEDLYLVLGYEWTS